MDAHFPNNPRLNPTDQRLYIDISKDLFDTFHQLKKILDEWYTIKDAGKVFIKEAAKILPLNDELTQVMGNKAFADQIVTSIYLSVFYEQKDSNRPKDNHRHQVA